MFLSYEYRKADVTIFRPRVAQVYSKSQRNAFMAFSLENFFSLTEGMVVTKVIGMHMVFSGTHLRAESIF